MITKLGRVPYAERLNEESEIMTKPLSDILDEMEANIRAATDAAKAYGVLGEKISILESELNALKKKIP